MNIFHHYKQLWFFNFKRFERDNYKLLREYYAEILITEVEEFMPLRGKKVLDVGGAKGEFCKAINEKRGCHTVNLDPYPGEHIWPYTVVGFGDKLPFKDEEFDLVISRGVLEHIPPEKQQKSLDEIYRVTKKKGGCYIMIPPWYNPHAGHSLKPFHIFPFKLARYLRELFFRKKVNANCLEEAFLYPITFRKMLKMISATGLKLIATKDMHFRLHFLTKIPIIREVAVPSVVFILSKS